MNDATGSPPARSLFSLLVLLVLVLAVTAQLITGFLLVFRPGTTLLAVHVTGGVIALVFTLAEWSWLCATHAGRYRLKKFLARGSGPADWSEGAFLLVATFTVAVGVLLAVMMHVPTALSFVPVLTTHRVLAIAVAALYVVHSLLSMSRSRRRRSGAGSMHTPKDT